jgi:hypothetical protein
MIGGLVVNSGGNIRTVFADSAYDGAPVYQAIRDARPRRSPPKIVIPPGKPSVPAKGEPHGGTERERHAAEIAAHGRMAWQRRHRYGKRSLVETAISRYPSASTAGGSPHEPMALSRTKSPFTSRSPTATWSSRGRHRSESTDLTAKTEVQLSLSVHQRRTRRDLVPKQTLAEILGCVTDPHSLCLGYP